MTDSRGENATEEDAAVEENRDGEETVTFGTTPGQMLIQAREAKNLTLDDVSAQTRLSSQVLEALENDAYDNLGEPVYVRGYLRRYARLLGLSEDEVLQAHEAVSGMSPPTPARPRVTNADEPLYPSRNWLPLLILLVVGCILVAVIIWWTRQSGPMANVQPAVEETSQQADSSASKGGSDIQAATPPVALLSPGAASPPEQPAATDSAQADQGKTAGISPQADYLEKPENSGKTEKNQDMQKEASEAGAGAAATIPVGEASSGTGPGEQHSEESTGTASVVLQLKFDHKCWVNIHDAEGERLMLGVARPGDTRTLHGKPPYKIVLGYARGVDMTYGGEPVDVAKHVDNGGVARFTVGEATGD